MGNKKFGGKTIVAGSILDARKPVVSHDKKLQTVFGALAHDACTLEGEYAFVKVVFLQLIGRLHFSPTEAKEVYEELTQIDIASLPRFTRLLAYRAYDLLITNQVVPKLDSIGSIVAEIQQRSSDITVGDWSKLVFAMKGTKLYSVFVILAAIVVASFWAGFFYSKFTNQVEMIENSESDVATTNSGKE